VPGLSEASLARFLARARRSAGLRKTVNIAVLSNREVQALNRRFRGKNKSTDVLSFPAANGFGDFAGDIAIAREIATLNAARLGHSFADEVKILSLHGILHLAGYDHETDKGEMRRKEEHTRRLLKLPLGLIERSGNGSRRNNKVRLKAEPRKTRQGGPKLSARTPR